MLGSRGYAVCPSSSEFTGQRNTIERKLVGREFLTIGDEDGSPLFRIVGDAVSQTSTLAIRAEPLKTLQSFGRRTCRKRKQSSNHIGRCRRHCAHEQRGFVSNTWREALPYPPCRFDERESDRRRRTPRSWSVFCAHRPSCGRRRHACSEDCARD
jgi:hypothetical protein